METMNVEPTQTEPTCFMQRWRERYNSLSLTMKIVYMGLLILIIVPPVVIYVSRSSDDSKENVNNPDSKLENPDVYYMKSLDQNSQPCKDFYAFVCGNLRNKYRKKNKDRFDTIAMMEKRARVSLNDFLTKPLNTSDSETLRQMKNFQQISINKTKVETEGIEPVLTVLSEIGGWSLLTNDSENEESWEQIVGSVKRAGFITDFPYHLQTFATFFPYYLQLHPDPNNSSVTAMLLTPLLNPKRPRVLPHEKRTMDFVKLVASLLNATNDQIDDDIRNCIDFEFELQKIIDVIEKALFIDITNLKVLIERCYVNGRRLMIGFDVLRKKFGYKKWTILLAITAHFNILRIKKML